MSIVALPVVAIAFVAVGYLAAWGSQGPGRFDRARYEALVGAVRFLPVPSGEVVELRVDRSWHPRTLHPRSETEPFVAGGGEGLIWASRSAQGELSVVIETCDRGHGGRYGFAFSDVPMTPEARDEPSSISRIDVPGPLKKVRPDQRIDSHWWSVFNDD
jgi:hypothetical protein